LLDSERTLREISGAEVRIIYRSDGGFRFQMRSVRPGVNAWRWELRATLDSSGPAGLGFLKGRLGVPLWTLVSTLALQIFLGLAIPALLLGLAERRALSPLLASTGVPLIMFSAIAMMTHFAGRDARRDRELFRITLARLGAS
jgi:hypothetical protein